MNDLINLLKQSEQIELKDEWLEFVEALPFIDEPTDLNWDEE